MYDLIGDIHGHATELKALLQKMGYHPSNGCWRHPERKVIFAGDFIDKGNEIREVLQLVKAMVDHGQALAVMGNHEYNAMAFAFQLPDGNYLRPHKPKNIEQHEATIKQFADHPEEWKKWIEWFYTLPLFLELPDLRIVHACWNQPHIEWLGERTDGLLNEKLLLEAHQKGTMAHTVMEETLKGIEIEIPKEYAWHDKYGHPRTSNRIKWWVDHSQSTYGDFLFNCPDNLKHLPVAEAISYNQYPTEAKPVFFGHYWLEASSPSIQTHNVVCLDYSVAKKGKLAGYRFENKNQLRNENFYFVKSI